MTAEVFIKKKLLGKDLSDFLITSADYDPNSKTIISFCVLQVCEKDSSFFEIIKYDSAHGTCHVHKYFEKQNDLGQMLQEFPVSPESFREFRKDIEENWLCYKKKYFLKRFKQKV